MLGIVLPCRELDSFWVRGNNDLPLFRESVEVPTLEEGFVDVEEAASGF